MEPDDKKPEKRKLVDDIKFSDTILVCTKGVQNVIGNGLGHDIVTGTMEEVQNSIDAKATTVKIVTTPKCIAFCDDGLGMTEGELLSMTKPMETRVRRAKAIGKFGVGFLAGAQIICKFRERTKKAVTVWVQTVNLHDVQRSGDGTVIDYDVFEFTGSFIDGEFGFSTVKSAKIIEKQIWKNIRTALGLPFHGTNVIIANGSQTDLDNLKNVEAFILNSRSAGGKLNKDELEMEHNLKKMWHCVMHCPIQLHLNDLVFKEGPFFIDKFSNPELSLLLQISAIPIGPVKKLQKNCKGRGGGTQVIFRYVKDSGTRDIDYSRLKKEKWFSLKNGTVEPAVFTTRHVKGATFETTLVHPDYRKKTKHDKNGILYIEQCSIGTMQIKWHRSKNDAFEHWNGRLMWDTETGKDCPEAFFESGSPGANKSQPMTLKKGFAIGLKAAVETISTEFWNLKSTSRNRRKIIEEEEEEEEEQVEQVEQTEQIEETKGNVINSLTSFASFASSIKKEEKEEQEEQEEQEEEQEEQEEQQEEHEEQQEEEQEEEQTATQQLKNLTTKIKSTSQQPPPKEKEEMFEEDVEAQTKRLEFTANTARKILIHYNQRTNITDMEIDFNDRSGGLMGLPYDLDHIDNPMDNSVKNGQPLDPFIHAIKTRNRQQYELFADEANNSETRSSTTALAYLLRALMTSRGFQNQIVKVTKDKSKLLFQLLNDIVKESNLTEVKWNNNKD